MNYSLPVTFAILKRTGPYTPKAKAMLATLAASPAVPAYNSTFSQPPLDGNPDPGSTADGRVTCLAVDSPAQVVPGALTAVSFPLKQVAGNPLKIILPRIRMRDVVLTGDKSLGLVVASGWDSDLSEWLSYRPSRMMLVPMVLRASTDAYEPLIIDPETYPVGISLAGPASGTVPQSRWIPPVIATLPFAASDLANDRVLMGFYGEVNFQATQIIAAPPANPLEISVRGVMDCEFPLETTTGWE